MYQVLATMHVTIPTTISTKPEYLRKDLLPTSSPMHQPVQAVKQKAKELAIGTASDKSADDNVR